MRGWSGFLTPARNTTHRTGEGDPRTRHVAQWTCQIISFPGNQATSQNSTYVLMGPGSWRRCSLSQRSYDHRKASESIRHGGWATALNIPDEKFSISSFLIKKKKKLSDICTLVWSSKLIIFFSSSDCNCRYENTISVDKLT